MTYKDNNLICSNRNFQKFHLPLMFNKMKQTKNIMKHV